MLITIEKIRNEIRDCFKSDKFIKISIGNYKGLEENLKQIIVKKTLIKNTLKFSFTYKYKTKDIVKNYSEDEAFMLLVEYLGFDKFRVLTIFLEENDLIFDLNKSGQWNLNRKKPSIVSIPSLQHDIHKKRKIATSNSFLYQLNITDALGNVFPKAQDKYKQINHYVEILSTLLKELPQQNTINVVDMGAGKGYLTFALYDYLNNFLQKKAVITGVEFRKDLVELCNTIALASNFESLQFVEGTIESYQSNSIDVLIALHACDTATDDAICKGIDNQASLIVVAPCCHKQIRRSIEKNNAQNDLDFLTKYGIFLERQAEMVTDGIRALVLEYCGYATKVIEFISDAHTPKNVLIIGIKKQKPDQSKQAEILLKISNIKAYFGIDYHHLEKIMDM